ncbi:DUF538 domain-containing protein [Myxococcota bacterium]|jgi:hypothetical protein|nr:DUF538 domain-containing protein [Myxococcota bacterium]
MVDKLLREDARQTQLQTQDKTADQDAADLAKQQGQRKYMQSLGKPAERARAAFRAAGIPLDKLLPEDVVSFEHKADGSFVLKLARELRVNIGPHALLLGTTISGVLSMQHIRQLVGIGVERTQGNNVQTARAGRLSFLNGELLLETDDAALKKINLRGEALGDLGG